MCTFCQRFGGSPERRLILSGLLDLRDALRTAGIVEGFQWLNGSFVEDVETLRGRAPADIDVVTFCAFGDVTQQQRLMQKVPEAFDPASAKATYKVDHYFVQTDVSEDQASVAAFLARWAAYWYSMWAHQRGTQLWKGFVSVPLDSNEPARLWMNQHAIVDGGTP